LALSFMIMFPERWLEI